MPHKRLTTEDLELMKKEFKMIREDIGRVAKRVAKDTVIFEWQPGEREELIFSSVWLEMPGGVYARALDTMSKEISLIVYSAVRGTTIPPHVHPDQSQATFVLEGEITVISGSKSDIFRENEVAIIPKGVRHFIMVNKNSILISKYMPRTFEEILPENTEPIRVIGPDSEEPKEK